MLDYLTLCAIVKDEERYLPEWVRYHRAIGVEKFLIWDNESKIPVADALGEVMDSTIRIEPIRGCGVQLAAYSLALRYLRGVSEWVAFLDADEVLVPQRERDFRNVLKNYEAHGGLVVNWRMFGSNGHATPPPAGQIRGFTRRSRGCVEHERHVKTIVRPRYAVGAETPHSFGFRERLCADEAGRLTSGPWRSPTYEIAQVNHYFIRSRQEWREKCVRGAADGTRKTVAEFEAYDSGMNDVEDWRAVELLEGAHVGH